MKKSLTSLAGLALTLGLAASASAAVEPISLVVPFTPGGASDSFARIVAKEIGEELGATVVVENKPGAGGSIGAGYVANRDADSRTILLGTISTHAINPYLYKSLSYDANADFTPLAMVLSLPNVLVVPNESPIKTAGDIQERSKAKELYYGSAGNGTTAHLSSELMGQYKSIKMTHIPYKGANPANMDLIGGQLDFLFDNISSVYPLIQSGKVRALAVTSKERSPQLPDVPSMHEQGYDGYEVLSWFGFWLPKGAPDGFQQELLGALDKVYAKDSFKQQVMSTGAMPTLVKGPDFVTFVKAEQEKWKNVVEKGKITIE